MNTTRFVMTATMIGLALYDIVAIQFGGIDASVSQWFAGAGRYPLLLLVIGYLLGHFWGWMQPPPEWQPADRRKLKDILRDRWPAILAWIGSHRHLISERIKALFGLISTELIRQPGMTISIVPDRSITSTDDANQISITEPDPRMFNFDATEWPKEGDK